MNTITSDWSGKTPAHTFTGTIGRECDPAGSMDDVTFSINLTCLEASLLFPDFRYTELPFHAYRFIDIRERREELRQQYERALKVIG